MIRAEICKGRVAELGSWHHGRLISWLGNIIKRNGCTAQQVVFHYNIHSVSCLLMKENPTQPVTLACKESTHRKG